MKIIKKNLKLITIILIIIIILGYIIVKANLSKKSKNIIVEDKLDTQEQEIIKLEETEDLETINVEYLYVDIKGAVQNPGVYEIEDGKKVIDVINLAGGFTKNADTSLINLAKKVDDEMVIIVYTKEEVKKARQEESIIKVVEKECMCPEIKNDACLDGEVKIDNELNKPSTDMTTKININSATLEELQTLSGIGESKAQAIIEYREKNGKFKQIEDLISVTGIGESLYEKIKNNITV